MVKSAVHTFLRPRQLTLRSICKTEESVSKHIAAISNRNEITQNCSPGERFQLKRMYLAQILQ